MVGCIRGPAGDADGQIATAKAAPPGGGIGHRKLTRGRRASGRGGGLPRGLPHHSTHDESAHSPLRAGGRASAHTFT